jgi:UDP-glucose 4-epimerase
MKRSLVTGGAGFIGSNLVDRLLSMGHEVVCVDNESSNSTDSFNWNRNSSNHKIDICNFDSILPLFEGIDYVFHLAAESRIGPTIENPVKAVMTNSLGTANILQCARIHGVKRVLYSSTSSAYGNNPVPNVETQPDDPLNPYSVSKVSGEKLCSMYTSLFGLKTIIFRYFNIYGNREPTKGQYAPVIGIFRRQKAAGQSLTVVGDGLQKRDFTNVSDVVEANVLAATTEIKEEYFGTVFNVGTGKNHSVLEIAKIISDDIIFIPQRPGEMRETLADNSKTKKIMGWEPRVALENYLASVK